MLGAKDECLNLESQIKLRSIPNIGKHSSATQIGSMHSSNSPQARPEGDFWKVKQLVHLLANKIDPYVTHPESNRIHT